MMKSEGHIESLRIDERSRRDFLIVSTSTLAATGVALSVWPLMSWPTPGATRLATPGMTPSATEPRGSEGSSNSGETETDPATGEEN